MYTKSHKLYPFSERNRTALNAKMGDLLDMSDKAEAEGHYAEAEELMNRACDIGAILHEMDVTSNGHVAWLNGAQVATAKRMLATA